LSCYTLNVTKKSITARLVVVKPHSEKSVREA
jgi:hypothetical protein